MRRDVLIPLVVLAAIAAGAAWYLRRGSKTPGEMPRAGDAPGSLEGAPPPARTGGAGALPDAAASKRRGEARTKRDALREQIARQLASRPATAAAGSGSAARPRAPTDPRPPGNLRDNLGGREALAARLNEDFMPLAAECIEEAQARMPQLAGMLAIGLETIADEELGAVVEVAEAAPASTVLDPLLLECIRESAFSLTLPPPLTSGREKFELTLPVEPAPAPGGPR
jgi:hypothetical protein